MGSLEVNTDGPPPVAVEAPVRARSEPAASPAADAKRNAEIKAQSQADLDATLAASRRNASEAQPADRPAQSGERDPVREVARSLVNVNKSPEAPATPQAKTEQGQDAQRDPLAVDLGDDVRAAILDMKDTVANAVRNVVDPKTDESGRVTFSVAGVDGVRVTADGKEFAVGVGNTTIATVSRDTGAPGGGHEASGAQSQRRGDGGSFNPIGAIADFFVNVLRHPLTWLAGGIIVFGWIVVAVMSAQGGRKAR